MLNNCEQAAKDGRYTWRHDSILYTLLHYISQLQIQGYEIYADMLGFKSTSELFENKRPDIALRKGNEIRTIELTCCFETNIEKSNEYKKRKYEKLEKEMKLKGCKLIKEYIEVTSLGFIPKTFNRVNKLLKDNNINTIRMKNKVTETAIRCSYFLYIKRNSGWETTEILKFI